MATFAFRRPSLVGAPESLRHDDLPVDATGTAFVRNDIVTVASGVVDKLEASGTNATAMALANEPSSDGYFEPIVGQAQGRASTQKAVTRLGNGVEIEFNTLAALSTANIGVNYELLYSTTTASGDLTMVVDNTSTSQASVKVLRVADPVHGGTFGDTGARVVCVVLDANAY